MGTYPCRVILFLGVTHDAVFFERMYEREINLPFAPFKGLAINPWCMERPEIHKYLPDYCVVSHVVWEINNQRFYVETEDCCCGGLSWYEFEAALGEGWQRIEEPHDLAVPPA